MDDSPDVIRHRMEETRASLSDKLEQLEQHVMETVHGAQAAVKETVADVKDAVNHTVADVKETFDLTHQMQKHPWAILGGSVALGFLAGKLLERPHPDPLRNGHWMPRQPWEQAPPSAAQASGNGHPAATESDEPGMLASLKRQFGPEIDRLKGMAVGAAMGVVRDIIRNAVPDPMKPQMAEVVDGFTVKLGGTPVRGPLLSNGG